MSMLEVRTSVTRQSTCKTRHSWLKGNVETQLREGISCLRGEEFCGANVWAQVGIESHETQ